MINNCKVRHEILEEAHIREKNTRVEKHIEENVAMRYIINDGKLKNGGIKFINDWEN